MKTVILFTLIFAFHLSSHSQSNEYIHTSGKYILGPCEDTLILRGVNYAPYNWGYSMNDLKMEQIAQTGANSVRIVWYQNNPDQTTLYGNTVALDSAISKAIQQKMLVILELHDFTCQNNATNLLQASSFWTNPAIVTILLKYKHSIIVNIANEALYVNWTGNTTTALNTYKSTYQNLITSLRNVANFDFPIMIDAPDCGQTSDAFISSNTAQTLIDFDPLHNLIFSAHAYWYGYANNDSLQMATKINNIISANFPFVLGEIANQQDDATMCQYNLNYQALLNYCQIQNVSWLAWSWDHDGCPQRQISSNGNFSSLTTYGNDIVNNPNYGLSNGVLKSVFLENNGCNQVAQNELLNNESFSVYPTIAQDYLTLNSPKFPLKYEFLSVNGTTVLSGIINDEQKISIINLENGVYFLSLNGNKKVFKIIKN